MAFGEDVGSRMFSNFYCSITSRQFLKHMFKLALRGLLHTVIGRCMVLGGPSDLVTTYNRTYNPTHNFPAGAYRGYPNF